MSLLQGFELGLSLGRQLILEEVDIELRAGEMLGLIGPNGAGKSSLLKLLAGLLEPNTGRLQLDHRDYRQIPLEQRAQRIAWLAQQGELHWPMTVENLVALGRTPHLSPWQRPREKDRAVVERILVQSDLTALRERPCDTLSGGERARVLLARALAAEPQILLADEPVAALDPAHQLDMMELLSMHCKRGRGVIVVLHDLALAAHFCQRLQLLHDGKNLAIGNSAQVLNPENLQRAYRIRSCRASSKHPFDLSWQRIDKTDQQAVRKK
jgi:iron complex transport system ATP-binding protein